MVFTRHIVSLIRTTRVLIYWLARRNLLVLQQLYTIILLVLQSFRCCPRALLLKPSFKIRWTTYHTLLPVNMNMKGHLHWAGNTSLFIFLISFSLSLLVISLFNSTCCSHNYYNILMFRDVQCSCFYQRPLPDGSWYGDISRGRRDPVPLPGL